MAEIRGFRALRFDGSVVDPANVIAPPYDVISTEQQRLLYARDPHNVIRIEYGETAPTDDTENNRYTRAAKDLVSWRSAGVLIRDQGHAIYRYRLSFEHGGKKYTRDHVFAAVRLEPWSRGVIKPHEHTLAAPKSDRLELLRATRTQVSPVYSLYRPRTAAPTAPKAAGKPVYAFESDGQRHELSAISDPADVSAWTTLLGESDVYIADGHHRYETALAYRDERLARVTTWTNSEPDNFVLMALTDASDPGLVVLPTHRVIHREPPPDALARAAQFFDVADAGSPDPPGDGTLATQFVTVGLAAGRVHRLTLRDRAAVEALMPPGQPDAWRRLDVNVLQYGLLGPVFGIDAEALAAGGAVTYTQDAAHAAKQVDLGAASAAALLRATPVDQILAVADAGGRMPQKSTFFHPKLPTGLVLYPLD
jgi:uncharacterized protein (DUF1015 family)